MACAQSPAGDAKHGKELFLSYACYSCHSFDGHGGAGARLVPMPLNQAAFIAFVRNAGPHAVLWSQSYFGRRNWLTFTPISRRFPLRRDAKSIPLIQELLKEN